MRDSYRHDIHIDQNVYSFTGFVHFWQNTQLYTHMILKFKLIFSTCQRSMNKYSSNNTHLDIL